MLNSKSRTAVYWQNWFAAALCASRPLTLEGVLKLKAEYPDARLVVGNTEVGIEMKFKDARYPVLIGVTHVPELDNVEVSSFNPAAAIYGLLLEVPSSDLRFWTLHLQGLAISFAK